MTSRSFITGVLLVLGQFSLAGIEDHFVYDDSERFDLSSLGAVVEVDVKHFSAYAEPRILFNYVEEHNRHTKEWVEDVPRAGKHSRYWSSFPDRNALSMLKENTYWVLEVEITSCLYGKCELGNALFVFKQTDAFVNETADDLFRDENQAKSARRILGLVSISETDFSQGLRNRWGYMQDSFKFLNSSGQKVARSFTVRKIEPSNKRCYVVRDVGISFKPSASMVRFGITGGNLLLQEVQKDKVKKTPNQSIEAIVTTPVD